MKKKTLEQLRDLADYTRLASIRLYDIAQVVLDENAHARLLPDELETMADTIETAYVHIGEMRDILAKEQQR